MHRRNAGNSETIQKENRTMPGKTVAPTVIAAEMKMGEVNPRCRQLAGQFFGVGQGRTMSRLPLNMLANQTASFGLAQAGGVIGGNQHHFMPVPGELPQQGFNENADTAAQPDGIFKAECQFHQFDRNGA